MDSERSTRASEFSFADVVGLSRGVRRAGRQFRDAAGPTVPRSQGTQNSNPPVNPGPDPDEWDPNQTAGPGSAQSYYQHTSNPQYIYGPPAVPVNSYSVSSTHSQQPNYPNTQLQGHGSQSGYSQQQLSSSQPPPHQPPYPAQLHIQFQSADQYPNTGYPQQSGAGSYGQPVFSHSQPPQLSSSPVQMDHQQQPFYGYSNQQQSPQSLTPQHSPPPQHSQPVQYNHTGDHNRDCIVCRVCVGHYQYFHDRHYCYEHRLPMHWSNHGHMNCPGSAAAAWT